MNRIALTITGSILMVGISKATLASAPTCTDTSQACVNAVALSYVNAVPGGPDAANPGDMRLAPNVIRWQNGLVTSQNASEIRNEANSYPPGLVLGVRDLRTWSATDGHNVFAAFLDDVQVLNLLGIVTQAWTVHIMERVQVDWGNDANGNPVCGDQLSPCITQIEVIQCSGLLAHEDARPAPSGASAQPPTFLCNRVQ